VSTAAHAGLSYGTATASGGCYGSTTAYPASGHVSGGCYGTTTSAGTTSYGHVQGGTTSYGHLPAGTIISERVISSTPVTGTSSGEPKKMPDAGTKKPE
ncbi:MAG TPA: hypothetical protein VMZ71_07820, partial [Gemmataceae bacterium]|nr:hypothetical protein [Gemmataceae bacterium]